MKNYSIFGLCLIALIAGCMFLPFLEKNIVTYHGNFLHILFTGDVEIGPRVTKYGSEFFPVYGVIFFIIGISSVIGIWKNLATGIISLLLGLTITLYAGAISILFHSEIANTEFKIGYFATAFFAVCFMILTVLNLIAVIKNRRNRVSKSKTHSNILDSRY